MEISRRRRLYSKFSIGNSSEITFYRGNSFRAAPGLACINNAFMGGGRGGGGEGRTGSPRSQQSASIFHYADPSCVKPPIENRKCRAFFFLSLLVLLHFSRKFENVNIVFQTFQSFSKGDASFVYSIIKNQESWEGIKSVSKFWEHFEPP